MALSPACRRMTVVGDGRRRGGGTRRLRWLGALCLALGLLGGPASSVAGGVVTPDPLLTPGATRPATLYDLCDVGTAPVAAVDAGLASEAMRLYRIERDSPATYVIDRLIPLSLGGADDRRNVWPQSTNAVPWNASRKDELERQLHFLVCRGSLRLETAQAAIASDWIAAYARYIGAPAGALRYVRAGP